ncbi:hypothetical protein [Nodosilinea nodulosa]|uniref:hypothetical protein n=1 Tax=Nodosilinea nodulosa TaxID=416001 RepID=UPI0002E46B2B|nr:hypothetical protein [Nodosilinea nodulosa]
MKLIIAFIVPLFIFLCAAASHASGKGIVALPGYSEAVVLCGEATVINPGHEADPEVAELLALAAEVCAAYSN